MTILTLQFGQCGNQVGDALFTYLANDIQNSSNTNLPKSLITDYNYAATKLWFCGKTTNNNLVPRSILIDTEKKVISSIVKQKGLLKYRNIISKCAGGSANNWAFGYKSKASLIHDDVLDMVRKEVDKNDDIVSVLNILSSGGGTGSGLGSNIIESIRDEYPNKTIVNVIVLPYDNGEVVTQSYNTLLTIAKLYDLTDGNILLENDILHKACNDLLAIKDVEFINMNTVIAQKISSILQPVSKQSLPNFVSQLTSHPSYKFVSIKTTPHIPLEYMKYESVQSWPTLLGHVRNTLRASNQNWEIKPVSTTAPWYPNIEFCKSVGNLLITRGGTTPEPEMLEPLMDHNLYAAWLPENLRFTHRHQPRNLYGTANFVTLATNNNLVCNTIGSLVEQAWTLYTHKAYLHQYEKYGVTENEFEVAFEKLDSIINSYKTL